jgi:signal transduction histidine kinase
LIWASATTTSGVRCRIDCELKTQPGACELWISNPAAELRHEDLEKLTEPFWRASASREDRAHAGLGLALASRLAELLRAELSFELHNGTFRASLRFHAGTNGSA